ncbi:hypothetical protein [Streptomyces sp. NPDC050287]|uniref:hypothetical protein n=1 Tax=Streptomyces sp. NPDC050287 TaxID=3365608 RepID=UPI0037B4BF43
MTATAPRPLVHRAAIALPAATVGRALPATVGRVLLEDVVLAPAAGPNPWQPPLDTAHPVFFDHLSMAVPGMLLEAVRRAVRAYTGGTGSPDSLRIAFTGTPNWPNP